MEKLGEKKVLILTILFGNSRDRDALERLVSAVKLEDVVEAYSGANRYGRCRFPTLALTRSLVGR